MPVLPDFEMESEQRPRNHQVKRPRPVPEMFDWLAAKALKYYDHFAQACKAPPTVTHFREFQKPCPVELVMPYIVSQVSREVYIPEKKQVAAPPTAEMVDLAYRRVILGRIKNIICEFRDNRMLGKCSLLPHSAAQYCRVIIQLCTCALEANNDTLFKIRNECILLTKLSWWGSVCDDQRNPSGDYIMDDSTANSLIKYVNMLY
jgi:hypothetical protein